MLSNLPLSGVVVIAATVTLFAFALILLFRTYGRYRRLQTEIGGGKPLPKGGFSDAVSQDYIRAYREYGDNTNTPAIINSAVSAKLGGLLMAERFINNAVSLFVTLGLFGTFLGLSLSVASLTELLRLSGSEEWLSILNSVGGGLMSSLAGMGVAFYTSLVGVACAILFTLIRTVWNPQAQREALETRTELWLDHAVAPGLETDFARDDESRLLQLKDELRAHAASVEKSLNRCTEALSRTLGDTTQSLGQMIESSKEPIGVFYETVNCFNENVRDFSQFNYELRGNIERMDVSFRDLTSSMRQVARKPEGGRGNETR